MGAVEHGAILGGGVQQDPAEVVVELGGHLAPAGAEPLRHGLYVCGYLVGSRGIQLIKLAAESIRGGKGAQDVWVEP